MRNRVAQFSLLIAFSAMLFISCKKEKIPPPADTKQVTAASNTKSDNQSTTSSSEGESSSPSSGCNHGG